MGFAENVERVSTIFLHHYSLSSVMFERLVEDGKEFEQQTRSHINEYLEAELRTLILAYREVEESEYKEFNEAFTEAKSSVSADRDELVDQVADQFERNLILLGATAVEDKLQNGVPECIDQVLTGDKMETAINIVLIMYAACSEKVY